MDLVDDYAAPSSETERKLADIWADVFELDRVGLDDDFFELGGDSLMAEMLVTALRGSFEFEFKQSQFLDINTPRKIAKFIDKHEASPAGRTPDNLVAVNPQGTKVPLFLIHGNAGIAFLRPEFKSALDPEQPIYIFQAVGYDGTADPLGSVEDMAAAYLRMMLEVRPHGPWNLAAVCAGGWIALEMLRLMELENLKPDHVILIDPVVQKQTKDEYRHSRVSRVKLPWLTEFLNALGDEAIRFVNRSYVFFNTGMFVEERAAGAIDVERVRDFVVRREMKRVNRPRKLKRFARRMGIPVSIPDTAELFGPDLAKIHQSEPAARTRAILKHAFRAYIPKPSDFPTVLIGSDKLSRSLADPVHPLNRLLPNRRILVSGQNHHEAVSSELSARILQKLVDGEDPDDVARLAVVHS